MTTPVDPFRAIIEGRTLERSLQIGLVALRGATWVWMAAVMVFEVYSRANNELPDVAHPIVAFALIGAAGGFTIVASIWLKTDPDRLAQPSVVVAELLLGFGLLLVSDWVWQGLEHSQNIASVWPVCGPVAAGLAFGSRSGALWGVALGSAGFLGIPLARDGDFAWSLGKSSTMFFFALTGWTAGYLVRRLRLAEDLIANARAREEVARTLHDGVLQTLAVIQRRSDDVELAHMAREQEAELRLFLTGATTRPDTLAAQLRQAAARHEHRHGIKVALIVADDLEEPPTASADAVAKAVGEALTNSAKHGQAENITVYLEPDLHSGIFCSVKDDGVGFDTESTDERMGLSRSIRGRIEEIGGRVEISSRPGRGTEVRLWTVSTRPPTDQEHES